MKIIIKQLASNVGQSVSHGTLRTQDLLSAFCGLLEGLVFVNGDYYSLPENFSERDRLNNLIGECQDCFDDNCDILPEKMEEAEYLLNESLFNELNEFAPAGYYFGAIEGDGSDFGFWHMHPDETRN